MSTSKDYYDEERYNALLSHFNIGLPNELCCQGKNMISRMCINPTCTKPSPVCIDPHC